MKIQRVVEFQKKNFWSSQIDTEQLNIKISELNNEGWGVITITPNTNFWGVAHSYTLLLEKLDWA